jgi:hypothetical protein
VDAVAAQRPVFERVRVVVGLLEVLLVELVGVDDEGAAVFEVGEVDLEGGRVHGDEDAGLVAGRADVAAGEVELEAGDAGQAAGGRANLGREVGQGRDVVADDGRGVRKLRAGELHAVAGVAGEADGDGLDLFDLCLTRFDGRFDDGAHGSKVSPLLLECGGEGLGRSAAKSLLRVRSGKARNRRLAAILHSRPN